MTAASIVRKLAPLVLVLFLVAACAGSQAGQPPGGGSTAVQSSASIEARPNPVPPGDGLGITTIVWKTGDGTQGQVYVSEDGAEDKLFDAGTQGSTPAPWIRTGSSYQFRLYAGSDHRTLLGSVTVTRAS
jgi:hypothetical protein